MKVSHRNTFDRAITDDKIVNRICPEDTKQVHRLVSNFIILKSNSKALNVHKLELELMKNGSFKQFPHLVRDVESNVLFFQKTLNRTFSAKKNRNERIDGGLIKGAINFRILWLLNIIVLMYNYISFFII